MPPISAHRILMLPGLLLLATTAVFPQQSTTKPAPSPSPSPNEQETIRTVTEEVQLTVTALDGKGRLDPSLEVADILVLEDRVAQELTSARRSPAHVLILLDTGGEINSAKRVRLTREIARNLVTNLNPHDEISILQFNNKVEILQDWSVDREAIRRALDTMIMSGKRARFFDAIIASAAHLGDRPQGNRHIVMITDGVQSPGERVDKGAALKQLQASNAVVHVISYTLFSQSATAHDRKFTRNRDKSLVPDDEAIRSGDARK